MWILTTVLFGTLGLLYVLFLKQDQFLASQALLVRDEATGAVMRLGRFQSQAEMKAAQETILEMSKSQQVVHDALVVVGQPKGFSSWLHWGEYPSKELVEDVSKSSISVHAPKGTEFGVTEVIYMDVKASDPEGALKLSKALCDSLESRLQQVRKARADGVISELTHARDSSKRELGISTQLLNQIESAAGSDLIDLRGMTDTVAGAATSRAEFDQIKNEIRQTEIARQSLIADREMLVRATEDPTSFIVAPGAVLNSQPGLKRLREGLVDAQLVGSQLSGRFTDSHPLVNASQTAQLSIVKRFSQELKASIAGVESDIALSDQRILRLETQRTAALQRLAHLADTRATYANLLSEVKSKVAMVENADRELAEAQAARDSSVSTSLLTRLDSAIVSDRPIGPGKSTLVSLCSVAGLVFGLGFVFIITPIDANPIFGRRSQDRSRGRRDADLTESLTSGQTVETETSEQPSTERTHSKLNAVSNAPTTRKLSSPNSEVCSDNSSMPDGYQPLIGPNGNVPILRGIGEGLSSPSGTSQTKETEPAASSPSVKSVLEIDMAFQELARLKSLKPENRSEELSLQMKVAELNNFVNNQENKSKETASSARFEDPARTKPRPARQTPKD